MKKKTKILLVCLLAIVVTVAGLCVWQWDNLHAFMLSRQYSDEEIETLLEENSPSVEAVLDKVPELQLTDLTEEDRQKLQDGTMTVEEAIDAMLGQTDGAVDSDSKTDSDSEREVIDVETGQPDDAVNTESGDQPDADITQSDIDPEQPDTTGATSEKPTEEDSETDAKMERIAELVARIYVYRDIYTAQLESIKNSAIAEYLALPESEQTSTAKRNIAMSCLSAATSLESECDSEVNTILAELRTLLKEVGGDSSLADEIKAAYAQQKALLKARYLNLYF